MISPWSAFSSCPAPAWCPAPWWMLAKTSDISASVPTGLLPLQCRQQPGKFLTSRRLSVGLQTTFSQMLHFLKTRQCNDFTLHVLERGACSVYKWINVSDVSALVKKLNASGAFVGIYFVLVPSGTQLLDWGWVSVSSKTDEGEAATKRSSLVNKFKCDQVWSGNEQVHASLCNYAIAGHQQCYTKLYITRCRKR